MVLLMSDKGFIKLDRKLLSWGWKDDPHMVALWVEILLQANIKEVEWHGIKFEPGSFPTSIEKLARGTGLSAQMVRTCLKKLKDSGEIEQKSTSQGTIIKVVKWAEYQGSPSQSNKRSTNDQQAINKRSTTIKEIKKLRNKEYIYMPTYDPSKNAHMTEEEIQELLKLRRS